MTNLVIACDVVFNVSLARRCKVGLNYLQLVTVEHLHATVQLATSFDFVLKIFINALTRI